MPEKEILKQPWMVAAWPGMGNVAVNAGYYLMAKLGMHLLTEFSARELFDAEHVEVKHGLIRSGRLPRSRCFLWKDPAAKRDLIVFIGEAQPPTGKGAFCRHLVEFAKQLGVERLYTFAAMATQMHPEHDSRVFCAATDNELLGELKKLNLEVIEGGHIGGLNGVVLGEAAESGLRGACLLGEMPHIVSQIPFPKASLAVLKVFLEIAGIEIDLGELSKDAEAVNQQLVELIANVEEWIHEQRGADGESSGTAPETKTETENEKKEKPAIDVRIERRIEELFDEARKDRSRAYELKKELDQHKLFPKYEDRFLDLFKEKEG